jgi:RNA polymerase sigma factor (sigma-70 family)
VDRRIPADTSSPTWPPDTDTVERCRSGDHQALTVVLSSGFPRLVAFFVGAGVPHAEADDLAADSCEGVVKNVSKLRDTVAFEAWFWAIARAKLRTWIRRTRRPGRFEPVGAPGSSPAEAVVEREEHADLRRALDKLTPRDRQLLWLREVEGLSYEEIGGRLRAAVGTVRVACHRARKRLETAYGEEVGESPEPG